MNIKQIIQENSKKSNNVMGQQLQEGRAATPPVLEENRLIRDQNEPELPQPELPANMSFNTDTMAEKKTTCCVLKNFHKYLSSQFYRLGFAIAKNPSYFIVIPVFLTIVCATGFQALIYEKDPEYLFSPHNGLGRHERHVVETRFPMNYSHTFDPSRITRISTFARLLVSAKDNKTMFRTEIWNSLMELDRAIQNLTITWEDSLYTYTDICAKWNSKCIENPVLALNDLMPAIENGTTPVDYPIMLFPLVVPLYYGGVEVNETEGYITYVNSIALNYWLKEGTWREKTRSQIFERKILQLLDDVEFENISIARFVSTSLEDELDRNTGAIVYYLAPTVFIMVVITLISVFVWDWVRSKIIVGIMGVITAGLSIACSFGILMYCGVPFIGISWAAPFLLLGIGLDDMFVLISAWNRTSIQSSVPDRLAETYSEAAVSITITSTTNMLSFFIGTVTPFPSVYIFCVYTGVAILVTYCFYITFFGGCLALSGYQEKKQRHVLTNKVVLAKSEAAEYGMCYSMWCAGGINSNDPWNPKDNKPHLVMKYFKKYFAKMLNFLPMKIFIIFIFLAYLAGAIYGCLQMKEGLEKKKLARDDSYLIHFFEVEDTMFRKFPYRIQVIINEDITYSDPIVKEQLLDLHIKYENLSCIGPSLYTQSWIRGFYRFLDRRPEISKKITDEASFIKVLKEEYLIPETPEFLDVVFNDNETRIVASRFIIQSYEIVDTNGDRDMMQAVRRVAVEAPFEVVTYFPFFVLFDQFLQVQPLTIQTIALVAVVMMVVSLVFIPNPLCSLWVIFSIVSIEVGVMGYMALLGVNLDCISMINLIMCIGFSVDFSAHISYAYLTAKVESPSEKVEECMFNLGLPVIQSGISTVAGVLIFVAAPSYIFLTFFKIIVLVIVFGTMHATLLLPVMLSLLGPGSFKKKVPVPLSEAISHLSESISDMRNCRLISLQKMPSILGSDQNDVFTLKDSGQGSSRSSSHSSGLDNAAYVNDASDTEST